jgi:hypothetical protein
MVQGQAGAWATALATTRLAMQARDWGEATASAQGLGLRLSPGGPDLEHGRD